jgi:hypothetical protein
VLSSPIVAEGSAVMDLSCARILKEPNEFGVSALPQTLPSAQDDGAKDHEAEKQGNNDRRNEPVSKAEWCLKRHDNLPKMKTRQMPGSLFQITTSYFCLGASGEGLLSPVLS